MTEKLVRLLNVGANVAVLGGLVFLGVEVRNNRAAVEAQLADGIAEGFLEVNALAVADSAAACIWSVGWLAPGRLSDLQAARFSMYARMDFNQYMRVHVLYETGLVHEEAWKGVASSAAWKMSTPGGQLFFAENPLPDSFMQAIERYVDALPPQGFMLGRDLPASCP